MSYSLEKFTSTENPTTLVGKNDHTSTENPTTNQSENTDINKTNLLNKTKLIKTTTNQDNINYKDQNTCF